MMNRGKMKVIFKIYKPDKAMQEYLSRIKHIHYDELIFLTEWKGGIVYEAVNEFIRKYRPAIGPTPTLWEKGNEIRSIKFRGKEYDEIIDKWCKENGLPEEIDDYEEEYVFVE